METTPRPTSPAPLTRADFMRLLGTGFGLVAFTSYVSACARDTADPTPAATVDFTINWGKSPYNNLQQKGGYATEQGVSIAQTMTGDFVAVSAACSYHNSALVYKGSPSRFYCPSCQSAYTTAGAVQIGPATKAIKTYAVTVNQSTGDIRVQG